MEDSKSLRQKLGLTLEQMAELLGCTTGQYAMAESGQRKLPLHALQVQSKIYLAYLRTLEHVEPLAVPECPKTQKFLQNTEKQLNMQLYMQEMQLEKLLEKHENLKLQLQIVPEINQADFLESDSIAAKRLQLIERKARQNFDQLKTKIWKLKLAISATHGQQSILQKE